MKLQHLRASHLDTGYSHRAWHRQRLNITAAVLLCCFIGLTVGIGMLVHEFNTARASVLQRAKLNYRMRDIQRVATLLDEAESGERGYLLLMTPEYLEPYQRAVKEIPTLVQTIKDDAAADALLQPRAANIERLTKQKLTSLQQSLNLFERGDRPAAFAILRADHEARISHQLQAHVSAAVDVLRARREEGEQRNLSGITTVRVWTVVSFAALSICVLIYTLQIRRLNIAGASYEARLATQASMLNTVVDEIPAMVAIVDREARYRLVNKAFERWSGKSRAMTIDRTMMQFLSEEEFERTRPYLARALQGETVTHERHFSDGQCEYVRFTYVPLILEGGEVGGVLSLGQDVTAERSEHRRLTQLSERDPLTELLNRAGFERYMEAEVAAGRGASLGVIYVDLDHFKPINDRFGHSAGDEVLCAFAQRLRESVRPTDAVARVGGDEFAVVLSGIRSNEEAQRVAQSIVLTAARSFSSWDQNVRVGASVGVAIDAVRHGGWRQLVARADEMAYVSKSNGRGRVTVFDIETGAPRAEADRTDAA